MKKYYLIDENPAETVVELVKAPHTSSKENDMVYFVHYRPEDQKQHDTVRIDKSDSRIVFSATGKYFRDLLRDKVIAK